MQKNNLYCDVCKINVQSEAKYALHEFSKKHCDNLLRAAKNKAMLTKQKVSKPEESHNAEESHNVNEPQKWNVVSTPGNIARYGYFVPGRIYETSAEPKEFNTEYDPYAQKYAENPNKDTTQIPLVKPIETLEEEVASLKRKKKKLRTCRICNVTILTVPEYEAHMKSPQHILKLKASGMGVSAHFVKASTDLHTVETDEKSGEHRQSGESGTETAGSTASSGVFPMLYCDVCELLLNSEQQFNAHVNGKSHNDNVQRKAEVKAKKQQLESPNPNQLYCFSCKVGLNNLYQYNEHKYGKKHQMKCRRLMRAGITIPPEERVSHWGMPRLDPNKPLVYPDLYEKFILERDKKTNSFGKSEETSEYFKSDSITNLVAEKGENVSNNPEIQSDNNNKVHLDHLNVSYNRNSQSGKDHSAGICHEGGKTDGMVISNESNTGKEKCILGVNDILKCNICCLEFMQQKDFDCHLTSEDHAKNIVEIKGKGMRDDEILNILINDKNAVKPDRLGRYSCSTCSITAGHAKEFLHHVSTVVHKQSEEDYKKKKIIEIKFAAKPDENGKYPCKTCQENMESLVEYNRHLHTSKHRDCVKAEKASKVTKISFSKRVKQKYIISGLKRRDFTYWRKKCVENPGARAGKMPAADSSAGLAESVPGAEAADPKTEDVAEKTFEQGSKRKNDDRGMNQPKRTKPNRPEPHIKPLMSGPYPPRPPPLLSLRYSRPVHPRNWASYPYQHFRPISYPQRPIFPFTRYQRPPVFHPMWPRYPPCYN